ncbi:MAG: copper oxidase [Planctomycetota bacterium]
MTRRELLMTGGAALAGAGLLMKGTARAEDPPDAGGYTPVDTPNGATLPFTLKGGVKEFHLIAEPVDHEFAPGFKAKCWGYNGRTPGPTIECVEGDRIRILVENRLPEATTIHWHGVLLPNGMDGVGGLNQPFIEPGETWAYEYTLKQHGTLMYHPHVDEMTQMAVGMMGLLIVHPKNPPAHKVDRDFAIMLHMWAIEPGTYRPDPAVMLDFNTFTFNSKAYPGTAPLVVRTGQRVRIRLGNLSMDEHPIHLHGFNFRATGTDGGPIPLSAQFPETTSLISVGATRDFEFVADAPGDWIMHCHKSHHAMNAMGHHVPNMLGVDQRGLEGRIRKLLPGYMAMGEKGMADMQDMTMPGPENTLPMMMGKALYGNIGMGGMFTIVKVRDGITTWEDPGWYKAPEGTMTWKVSEAKKEKDGEPGKDHGGHK